MPPTPDSLPNYHFMLIAPNLGSEWLFDAGRMYWERFRPIVVSDLELVRLIPRPYTVTVTVIARRDTAAQWGVWLTQVQPEALFDPVVYDLFEEAKVALNQRAEAFQPFGVPLKPSPTPEIPLSPTPGAILGDPNAVPTRPAGGFVTQTPTPDLSAPTPQPTPPAAAPAQPITPTPGSLIGGS